MEKSFEVKNEILELIWKAINQSFTKGEKTFYLSRYFSTIEKKSWVYFYEFQDILLEIDPIFFEHVRCILNEFNVNHQEVCQKPKLSSTGVVFREAYRMEDMLYFLILLKYLGFNIDLYAEVRKYCVELEESKVKVFSEKELEIFWFEKFSNKAKIILSTGDFTYLNGDLKTFKNIDGFKISVRFDVNNKPIFIEVAGPKFRKRKAPVLTKCEVCDYDWFKGDTESSAGHRKAHKRVMGYLAPKPHKHLTNGDEQITDFHVVDSSSPKWMNFEMYERAYAFKKEMKYDFISWRKEGYHNNPECPEGVLFTSSDRRIIGAAKFYRDLESRDFWTLEWIWICPSERRKGNLKKVWNSLRKRYEDFYIFPPVSPEMQKFLKSVDDEYLMNKRI